MISHIDGKIESRTTDVVVLEAGGIGYEIHVPTYIGDMMPADGERCKLFVHSNFSEDHGTSLYGFMTREDRDLFRLLLTVSGIGPKVGLSILSSVTAEEIAEAIIHEDLKALTHINGVGKKTAQRLVLELKDKVADMRIMLRVKKPMADTVSDDAVDALQALGYSRTAAVDAVEKARETFAAQPKVEELIKVSLRYL
ncbi:MAG: Holliday junction DNA helicase RuvA [Methanocella sp. PtaU1.Bin125]|nr:MAG: Holliday junction DNA helicase RuvA [Methanocella sp. PtaU1.Bin125]